MSARDMFRDMGIPIPPPIEVRPLARPTYFNHGIYDFETWRAANLQALTRYWHQLVTPSDADVLTADDFHLFTLAQYDSEMDRRDELRRAYGSNGDHL